MVFEGFFFNFGICDFLFLSAGYKFKFNQPSGVEVTQLLETAKACVLVRIRFFANLNYCNFSDYRPGCFRLSFPNPIFLKVLLSYKLLYPCLTSKSSSSIPVGFFFQLSSSRKDFFWKFGVFLAFQQLLVKFLMVQVILLQTFVFFAIFF